MIGYMLRESQLDKIANIVHVHHKLITDIDTEALEDYIDRSSSNDNIRLLSILNKTSQSRKGLVVSLFTEKAARERDRELYSLAAKSKTYDTTTALFSVVYNDPYFLTKEHVEEKETDPKTRCLARPKKIKNVCAFWSSTPSVLDLLVEHQSFDVVNCVKDFCDYRFKINFEKSSREKIKFLKDERVFSLFFTKADISRLGYRDDIEAMKDVTFHHVARNNCFHFPAILDFLERHIHHQSRESDDFVKDIFSRSSFDFLLFAKDNLRDKAKQKLIKNGDLWSFFEKTLIEKSPEIQQHFSHEKTIKRRVL